MILPTVSVFAGSLLRATHLFVVYLLAKWMWLLLVLLIGHFRRSITSYIFSRPEKTMITGMPTVFGQWLTGLSYHIVSSQIVRNGYNKVWLELWSTIAMLL